MNEDITALRAELFATLRGLRDPNAPLDLERARAVADVAQTIINTAKVEVDFMRTTGRPAATGFLPQDIEPPKMGKPSVTATSTGTLTTTPDGRQIHKLR